MYASLATELGWTFQSIDDLTLMDVDDIMDHWKDNPPVPMLVRAYLGIKKEAPKKATKQDLKVLLQQFGGG